MDLHECSIEITFLRSCINLKQNTHSYSLLSLQRRPQSAQRSDTTTRTHL